jgi:hypothetical protein
MHNNGDAYKAKISPEFSVRLAHLKPQQKIRAMVMLGVDAAGKTSGQRQARAERQAMIEQIRHAAAPALLELDDILKHYNGKRLAAGVNALGAVPIETTAAGIHALAASERVAAILEDQTLSLLSTPSNA